MTEKCSTPRLDPWKISTATVMRVQRETADVITYDLEFADASVAENFHFLPGQFNMLYVPGIGEAAISIAGKTVERGWLRHSIRSVGKVTNAIEAGGVGMQLGVRGPFGTSWPVDVIGAAQTKPHVVLVAGGVGLAPLRSMVEYLLAQRQQVERVSLLIGARKPEDVLYNSDLDQWSSEGIDVQLTVDRPTDDWKGHIGVVTLLLERLSIPNPDSTLLMTCGPEVMMRYVAKSAFQRGIEENSVWVTMERNMNCAVGLCGHCQLGPQFLCKDGPVFRFDAVGDWLRIQDL